jgi:serine/threonine protein kinase
VRRVEEVERDEGLAPGDVLGKYRLERVVGAGGMAIVWRAVHDKLGQVVAIKVLRRRLCAQAALVERFEREGRALSKLRSRHAVRVLDVDLTPAGAPYLVMEWLEGNDLDQELATHGPLPTAVAVEWIREACRALAEAHALGIVHRDLKPANLFLATEGDARVLKVLDFGIAKEGEDPNEVRLTQTHAVMGTPLYMSPEQFRGTRDADARSDVWSLGATLFQLITGRPPFVGSATSVGIAVYTDPTPPVRAYRPDAPPELIAVIERCLEKSPDARFADAAALGAALAAIEPSAGPLEVVLASALPEPLGAPMAPPISRAFSAPAGGPLIVDAPTELALASAPSTTANEPTRSNRRNVWPWFAGAAALLVAGGVAFGALHGRGESAGAPGAGSASTSANGNGRPAAAASSGTVAPTPRPNASTESATTSSSPGASSAASASESTSANAASSQRPTTVASARASTAASARTVTAAPRASTASPQPSSPPLFIP